MITLLYDILVTCVIKTNMVPEKIDNFFGYMILILDFYRVLFCLVLFFTLKLRSSELF